MDNPLVAVEFRDGEKMVPYHVAVLLRGMETHTMVYDDAIRAANQALARNALNKAQKDLVATHMRTIR